MLALWTFSEEGSNDFVLPLPFFFFTLSVSTCSRSAWLAWNSQSHNNYIKHQLNVPKQTGTHYKIAKLSFFKSLIQQL